MEKTKKKKKKQEPTMETKGTFRAGYASTQARRHAASVESDTYAYEYVRVSNTPTGGTRDTYCLCVSHAPSSSMSTLFHATTGVCVRCGYRDAKPSSRRQKPPMRKIEAGAFRRSNRGKINEAREADITKLGPCPTPYRSRGRTEDTVIAVSLRTESLIFHHERDFPN